MPASEFPHLVDAAWLEERLGSAGLVVVDASVGTLRGQPSGIPGARRFDLDGAMSRHDTTGVHDMLDASEFQRQLRLIGINGGDRVVAYDAQGIFSSARAWWMLRAAGIDAAVLDGGLPAWEASGFPVSPVAESVEPGSVTVHWRDDAFVDADDVSNLIERGDAVVLDARAAGRFDGVEPEPRPGLRTGHIPGSTSLPFASLQRDGHLLPVVELADRLDARVGSQPVVTTCGSGVTACVLALAATLTGRDNIRVYDGSWADWGRPDSGRAVETTA